MGGAVTGLYADDPAAPEVRPTADVDCVIEISSRAAYHRMEDHLRRFGFVNDISEGSPLCRRVYRGVRIDVMPNDAAILGFSNRWYAHARENSSPFRLPGGATIRILRAPVFLATKLEALKARGGDDLRTSPDFEDIVFLINTRTVLVDEVKNAEAALIDYIRTEIGVLQGRPEWREALESAMEYGAGMNAIQRVLNRVAAIAAL